MATPRIALSGVRSSCDTAARSRLSSGCGFGFATGRRFLRDQFARSLPIALTHGRAHAPPRDLPAASADRSGRSGAAAPTSTRPGGARRFQCAATSESTAPSRTNQALARRDRRAADGRATRRRNDAGPCTRRRGRGAAGSFESFGCRGSRRRPSLLRRRGSSRGSRERLRVAPSGTRRRAARSGTVHHHRQEQLAGRSEAAAALEQRPDFLVAEERREAAPSSVAVSRIRSPHRSA